MSTSAQASTRLGQEYLYIPAVFAMAVIGCGDTSAVELLNAEEASGENTETSMACEETTSHGDASKTADGYTLLTIHENEGGFPRLDLIDMNGGVIKSWRLLGDPGLMLPGGGILGRKLITVKPGAAKQWPDLVQQSWSGEREWIAKPSRSGGKLAATRQHHDLQRFPNPVGYFAPGQAPTADGRTLILSNTVLRAPAVSDNLIVDDVILEYTADGLTTPFHWRASDHVDEFGFDAEDRKEISDNPNVQAADNVGDWIHLNAMSTLGRNRWYEKMGDERFHPDNIMISSRQANMMAIISRETGRVVWRVGPDYGEGQPEHALDQIVGQHQVHIIPHGLPGAGNVLLLDNGGLAGYGDNKAIRTHSRVLEFNPITMEKVWEYGGPKGVNGHFFNLLLGGVQRLPNGNTLITDGYNGRVVEVTSKGEEVWVHKPPVGDKGQITYFYRAQRVPPEWLPAGKNTAGYQAWSERFNCPG